MGESDFPVWITAYALTKGVVKRMAKARASGLSIVEVNSDHWIYEIYHKPDWFTTKEEALADAEKQRLLKIASVKKQLAKLEAMTFTAED